MGQLRTSSTIAMGRWLKLCLYKAGIDTSMFTRAAATTKATMSGVTEEDIQYVIKQPTGLVKEFSRSLITHHNTRLSLGLSVSNQCFKIAC